MRLLAFDPGKLTGVAVLEGGEWQFGMTVDEEFVNDMLFRCLVMLCSPNVVVVEALPHLVSYQTSDEVAYRIKHWFKTTGYQVEEVNPGQWKGMSNRVAISGTHQVDAATMAAWYYRTRLVNVLK